jgi:PAS domain S-box-containing protein
MKKNKSASGARLQGAELRRKAEQLLSKKKEAGPVEIPAEKNTRALVHELQVHQIELEMQNEELLLSQAATQEISDKYADLFDFAPSGHFLWDQQGKILELNLAGAILLGLERSAAIKKRFAQFVALEDRPAFADFCKKVMQAKTKQSCEIKLLIDVKPIDVLIEAIAGQYLKGEGTLCRAAVIDISDRKQAATDLRQSRDELQAIYDSAVDGLLVAEIGTMRIVKTNSVICRMLGYSEDELLSMSVDDIYPPGLLPAIREQLKAIAEGRLVVGKETTILRKDGNVLFAVIGCSHVLYDGQPCIIGFFHDITDRKQAEEALQKAHDHLELRVEKRTAQLRAMAIELTKSEQRERDRLAQVLHDELQQLLFAARMKVSLLRNSVEEENIRQTIEQLDELLKQSISESRSLAVELSPPILQEKGLAAGLAWLAAQIKEKHGLAVTVDAESEAEPLTDGVRILLYQMAKELLFNVAKHARTDCAQVKIARTAQGQVHIEVSDNGAGFTPDKLYTRADSGGGFGLSSIRQRLEMLGGRLKVDSTPGKGTRMLIQAPWRELPQPLSQTAAGPDCQGSD